MSKKKQQTPPRPPQFTSTPFSALKGIAVCAEPEKSPVPQKPTPPAQHEEDAAELFLQAMAGAKPLNAPHRTASSATKGNKPVTTPRSQATPQLSPEDKAASELFQQEIGRLRLEVKFADQLPDEDELKPLSGNRLKQLKRGIITVDHQLDLHGLTREEALGELQRFLRSARQRGQAAALVITGKGLNSPNEPVLQQAVAAWLRDAGRELVVEYAPAPKEMGGSGAFVIFLRPLPDPA